MAVQLDHLIIPTVDRRASAKLLGEILDVPWSAQSSFGPFSPVYINESLTIDFDEWTDAIPKQHYCFKVSDSEFNATLARLQAAQIPYRSLPHGETDCQVNEAFGGRLLYWDEPSGHVWEILTESYARCEGSKT
jgi:hypothetical protein